MFTARALSRKISPSSKGAGRWRTGAGGPKFGFMRPIARLSQSFRTTLAHRGRAVLAGALLAAAGCGDGGAPRSTLDGVPAPAATDPAPVSPAPELPATRPDLSRWNLENAEFIVEAEVAGDVELHLVRGRSDTAWTRLTASPGRDGGARWAPEGTWIAFETDRASEGDMTRRDIFRLDLPRAADPDETLDAREAVPLVASPAIDESPSISPDGTRIAFRSTRTQAGGAGGPGHLWTSRLDAPADPPVRVTREPLPVATRPSWHPSGRDLVFAKPRVEGGPAPIVLVSLDGIRERTLVGDGRANGAPHPSPDGARIAWTVPDFEGDGASVVVAAMDGSGAREIARGRYRLTDWTPDGAYLVADRRDEEGTDVVLIPLDGGAPEPLLRTDRPISGAVFRPPPRVRAAGG
jgi:Tol biopolymer transport system component